MAWEDTFPLQIFQGLLIDPRRPEEARVFAGDEPCNGEEIHRASARFDARQTVTH